MSPTTYYYVRPTDSLFVRGNLAFGDSGEHGNSQMPPPPSLFAGAFRSALLGQDVEHLSSFLSRGRCTDVALGQCLGSPDAPGTFRVTWLSLAGDPGGQAAPEPMAPLPADLLMLGRQFARLEPRAAANGVQSAGDLPLRATLVSAKQEKPRGGIFLRGKELAQHLQGQAIEPTHGIESSQLFQRDPRLGIGLNTDAHTAEEGQIYTTEGFAFSPQDGSAPVKFVSTGFLVGLQGVSELMPRQGVLRLGGDGRSAHYRRVDVDLAGIGLGQIRGGGAAPAKGATNLPRFRLILQTPALFSQGWLPEGVTQQADGSYRLQGDGFTARLACAALGRREVVSGWDLFNWKPKSAQAAVPAGSVYWFDELTGDTGKLAAWLDAGLWPHNPDALQQSRRAEGFNRALLGAWN
jgi:CRISPR-associated protein Cmr3